MGSVGLFLVTTVQKFPLETVEALTEAFKVIGVGTNPTPVYQKEQLPYYPIHDIAAIQTLESWKLAWGELLH